MATATGDTNTQTLSLDEFQRLKDQHLKELMQNTREHFSCEISAIYSDPKGPYKYPSKAAKNATEDWLNPDKVIFWNDGSSDDEENPQFTEVGLTLEQRRKQWQATKNEQIMMLRFPLRNHRVPSIPVPLTLEQDDKARRLQNEAFVKEYCVNTGQTVYPQRIEDLSQLRRHIDQFLFEQCSNTNLATIVFNGHGSCTRTADNSHYGTLSINRSGKIPCNEIIIIVQESLDRIRDNINPQAVNLIFAQCYGHKHSHNEHPDCRIKVIPLTSSIKPKTHTTVKLSGVEVTMAAHRCLEAYAEDVLEEIRRNEASHANPLVQPQPEASQPPTSVEDVVYDSVDHVPQLIDSQHRRQQSNDTALDVASLFSSINLVNASQDSTPAQPSSAPETNIGPLTETPQARTTELPTTSAVAENSVTGYAEQNMTGPIDEPSIASSSGFFSMISPEESSLPTSSLGTPDDTSVASPSQSNRSPTLVTKHTETLPTSPTSSYGSLGDATARNQTQLTSTPTSSFANTSQGSPDDMLAHSQPQGTSTPTSDNGNTSHALLSNAMAQVPTRSTSTQMLGIDNTSHGLHDDATARSQPASQAMSTPTSDIRNVPHSQGSPDDGIAHSLPQSTSTQTSDHW